MNKGNITRVEQTYSDYRDITITDLSNELRDTRADLEWSTLALKEAVKGLYDLTQRLETANRTIIELRELLRDERRAA